MTTEFQTADPYDAVVIDLRAKRDEIDRMIAFLDTMRGNRPASVGRSSAPSSTGGGITETAGMFLGMSIVDGAKKLLAMRKQTLGNVEIARALAGGGMALNSAEPANVVGSVLTRRFTNVGDVVKVGRGIWGLKEWYPGRTFKPLGKNVTLVSGGSEDPVFVGEDEPALAVQPIIQPIAEVIDSAEITA